MVQLAAAQGATVVAVVGNEEKAAFARSLGAAHAVVHRGDDVADAVRAVVGPGPVHVVLDPVQGTMGAQARRCSRPTGDGCCAGTPVGSSRSTRASTWRITRSSARPSAATPRDVMRAMETETQDAVLELWRAGKFRPVTTTEVAFEAVPAALAEMGSRRTIGRVVVRVAPDE